MHNALNARKIKTCCIFKPDTACLLLDVKPRFASGLFSLLIPAWKLPIGALYEGKQRSQKKLYLIGDFDMTLSMTKAWRISTH